MTNRPFGRLGVRAFRRLGGLAFGRLSVCAFALLGASIAQAQQKEAPPRPGTPKDIRLPAKRTFTLDNGLRVSLVPFGSVPKAALQLNVLAGAINETADQTWLSQVVGELLEEGTKTRTGAQLAGDAASMGGSLNVGAGADYTTIAAEVLSERAADAARLIADVAINSTLPESELARVKATLARNIAIGKTVPQNIADEKFQQVLYGDHPYGRTWPREGQLEGYTIEQARQFYRENFGAQRAHLIVVGVFNQGETERAIREAFGGWTRGSIPAAAPVPAAPAQRSLTLLDRPDAPQSTINLGLRIPQPSSEDYIPIRVTDYLLGGSFGSRVTTNIREDKGYTYSPYSFTYARQRATHWEQAADVTTAQTGNSLKEIFGEIDRLSKEAPPVPEVRSIQNQMVGIFTVQTSSRTGIVGRLTFADIHGVGDAYLSNFVRNVMAVTPEDVRRMTATYLRPEKMTLVVVGDKKTIEAQLAPYAGTVP
jgi:zinc protease